MTSNKLGYNRRRREKKKEKNKKKRGGGGEKEKEKKEKTKIYCSLNTICDTIVCKYNWDHTKRKALFNFWLHR